MGTPVPSREVEMAVKNCVDPEKVEKRKLTEEERRYYDSITERNKKYRNLKLDAEPQEGQEPITISERVIYDMANKIDPPAKGILIDAFVDALAKQPGKSKALKHVASKFAVSIATVYVWIKDYDIQFDESGNVIRTAKETLEEVMQAAEHELCSGEPATDSKEFDGVIPSDDRRFVNNSEGIISEAAVESNLEQPEDFVLINKMYRFGELIVDIQFDNQKVVIIDIDSLSEISIKFEKVKSFAGSLHKVVTELNSKEEK